MSNFNASETTNLSAELAEAQSNYRTIVASLNGAKRRGSKADVRELTRAKNRISARLDQIKNQMNSRHSAY